MLIKHVSHRGARAENRKSVQIRFYNNRTVEKCDIHSDGFTTETACNPQFKLKLTKITLLTFSVRIKNALKHYTNTR